MAYWVYRGAEARETRKKEKLAAFGMGIHPRLGGWGVGGVDGGGGRVPAGGIPFHDLSRDFFELLESAF